MDSSTCVDHTLQVGEQRLTPYSVTKKVKIFISNFFEVEIDLLSLFLAVRTIYYEGKKIRLRKNYILM